MIRTAVTPSRIRGSTQRGIPCKRHLPKSQGSRARHLAVSQLHRPDPDRGGLRIPFVRGHGSSSRHLVEVLDDLRRRRALLLARGGMAAPTVSQLRRLEPARGCLRISLARGPGRPSRVLVDLDDPCRCGALLLARGGMAAPDAASRGLTRVPVDLILRRRLSIKKTNVCRTARRIVGGISRLHSTRSSRNARGRRRRDGAVILQPSGATMVRRLPDRPMRPIACSMIRCRRTDTCKHSGISAARVLSRIDSNRVARSQSATITSVQGTTIAAVRRRSAARMQMHAGLAIIDPILLHTWAGPRSQGLGPID
jgi:hypothetical protein